MLSGILHQAQRAFLAPGEQDLGDIALPGAFFYGLPAGADAFQTVLVVLRQSGHSGKNCGIQHLFPSWHSKGVQVFGLILSGFLLGRMTFQLILAARQAESIDQDKLTHKFIRKLYALLESNQIYLDDKNNPGELGFGTCLGYQDDTFLYLHSELCHKVIRKFCEEQGENFSCTHKSLLKAMAEEGLILPGKEQNTRHLRVGNKQKRVIFMYREKAERIRDAAS